HRHSCAKQLGGAATGRAGINSRGAHRGRVRRKRTAPCRSGSLLLDCKTAAVLNAEVRSQNAEVRDSSCFFALLRLKAFLPQRSQRMRKERRGTCEFLVIASAFLILHSEFSLLHSDFRPSPVISHRKPLDLPYDYADPQRSWESFLRLSALSYAPADLLARVGRRSVCHGPAGEQTHPARPRRRVVPLVPCDGSRVVRRPGNCGACE